MYGELTDKETITRLEQSLEQQTLDQVEILIYKKNSESLLSAVEASRQSVRQLDCSGGYFASRRPGPVWTSATAV